MSEPQEPKHQWNAALSSHVTMDAHLNEIYNRLDSLEAQMSESHNILNDAHNENFERLAALEAQPAPGPECAPGWEAETSNEYQCGIAKRSDEFPDVIFRCSFGSPTVFFRVCEYTPNEHKPAMEGIELTADQLRNLIGAAMAVLKRMESEGESRDSV